MGIVITPLSPDKASSEGQWKKKKGVVLEEQIRELMLKSDAEMTEAGLEISNDRDSLGPEAEDAIIQLFDLVNEKNDLFRRQTLLLYMKRTETRRRTCNFRT